MARALKAGCLEVRKCCKHYKQAVELVFKEAVLSRARDPGTHTTS